MLSVSRNIIALSPPLEWHIPSADVTIKSVTADSSTGGANIVVSADHTALYVTLTTLVRGQVLSSECVAALRSCCWGIAA